MFVAAGVLLALVADAVAAARAGPDDAAVHEVVNADVLAADIAPADVVTPASNADDSSNGAAPVLADGGGDAAPADADVVDLPVALPPSAAAWTPPLVVQAFAAGRLRAVFDDAAALGGATVAGPGWTGRVGVAAPLGPLRGTVVVGDGAWWLGARSMTGPAAPGPRLVATPVAPALLHATLAWPVVVAGVPVVVRLGRQTPVVGDGRWWGAEAFDARGRSADGIVVEVVGEGGPDLRMGALWTDAGGAADAAPAGFVALARRGARVDVDVYGIASAASANGSSTEEPAPDTVLAGTRAVLRTGPVDLVLGVDALAAVTSTAATPAGTTAWHGELSLATTLPWALRSPRPFVDVGAEVTGGALRWRTPAPTVHGTLGSLDRVDVDDTVVVRGAAGVVGDDGFDARLVWRFIAPRDGGALRALGDAPWSSSSSLAAVAPSSGIAIIDAEVVIPLADDVALQLAWAGAPLTGGFAQRVLVSLTFALGAPEGVPVLHPRRR